MAEVIWKRQAGTQRPDAWDHPLETQARSAKQAVDAWDEHCDNDEIVDLITALLHLADKRGHEYTAKEIVDSAYEQYAREIDGEGDREPK